MDADQANDWYELNTRGTEGLLDTTAGALRECSVFISGDATTGRSPRKLRLLTEAQPPWVLSQYGRSKWLAECYQQTVHLTGEATGMWVCRARRRAWKELDYAPIVELEAGMRRAVAWCRVTGRLA